MFQKQSNAQTSPRWAWSTIGAAGTSGTTANQIGCRSGQATDPCKPPYVPRPAVYMRPRRDSSGSADVTDSPMVTEGCPPCAVDGVSPLL